MAELLKCHAPITFLCNRSCRIPKSVDQQQILEKGKRDLLCVRKLQSRKEDAQIMLTPFYQVMHSPEGHNKSKLILFLACRHQLLLCKANSRLVPPSHLSLQHLLMHLNKVHTCVSVSAGDLLSCRVVSVHATGTGIQLLAHVISRIYPSSLPRLPVQPLPDDSGETCLCMLVLMHV